MHDAPHERQRVAANIGAVVLAFCIERLRQGGQFHMAELNAYVQKHHESAPASADRILRQLRAEGKVAYEVLNRSESLYQLKKTTETPPRGDVGGVPRGLFGDEAPAKGRGIDAVKGR